MKTATALILAGLVLCSCESEEEVKNKWVANCIEAEFTAKQCEVLYSIKHSSDVAATNAAVATGMSGVATGMASGASASRR